MISNDESQNQTIRVVLADDEPMMRDSLRIIIDSQPDLRVVGAASTGVEAVKLAQDLNPDVVLMDIRMPGGDGIHATRQIVDSEQTIGPRVLVFSMYALDEYVYGALKAGASGFILKDTEPEQLLDAIRRIYKEESLFAPSILTRLIKHYVAKPQEQSTQRNHARVRPHSLTPRETEILVLIAEGLSSSEIVGKLLISSNTLKTHIGNLLAKLEARDRAQLVIAAYELGFA